MAYTDVVTKPIVLKDVSDLIGAGTNDLATLCTSSMINKWSKRKPFNTTTLFFQQDAGGASVDRDTALKNDLYGLTTAVKSGYTSSKMYGLDSFGTVKDAAQGGYWIYKTRTAPYRLADFIGYTHKAVAPATGFDTYNAVPISAPSGVEKVLEFSCGISVAEGGDSVGIADLANQINMTSLYLCCGFELTNGNVVWRTASTPLNGNDGITVRMLWNSDCQQQSGEHTLYWCLATTKRDYADTAASGARFIPIPFSDILKATGKAVITDRSSGEGGGGGSVVIPGISPILKGAGDDSHMDLIVFKVSPSVLELKGNTLIIYVQIENEDKTAEHQVPLSNVTLQLGDHTATGQAYNESGANITTITVAKDSYVRVTFKAIGLISQFAKGEYETQTIGVETNAFSLSHILDTLTIK